VSSTPRMPSFIRDTADKNLRWRRNSAIDRQAKPEVLIDVAVLEVDRSFHQKAWVTPPVGVNASNPPGGTGTSMSIKDLLGLEVAITVLPFRPVN